MRKMLPKFTQNQYLWLLCSLSLWPVLLSAQPSNDDCIDAIPLTELQSYCSDVAAFTTNNSTPSTVNAASCFPSTQTINDVWFSFVAEATDVNIAVRGSTSINQGGTLNDPQFALYSGTCGNLTQIACASDAFNDDVISVFAGPLQIGQTYFIRVSARQGQTGTFQLCVNNFNAIPDPNSDCNTGVILCDKSPFSVQFVSGVGTTNNEINNVSCDNATCDIGESNSAWYKWTCDQPGSLTFNIAPLNSADDIDFVLYELPLGVLNCANKMDIRCMASGENVGSPLEEWEPCTGVTGLSLNDGDISEACGCQTGDNNFVDAITMEAGKSYALVINNFSASGDGFSIDFGGTGTFLGPEAAFRTNPNTDTLCLESTISFIDESSFVGGISGWSWTFGADAVPATANTQGPHNVQYSTPGLKSIVLQVETDEGCVVTAVSTVYVQCCDGMFDVDANITDVACPNDNTGAIDLSVNNPNPPYIYSWNTEANTQDISGLLPGPYTVTITDQFTCDTVITFIVDSPPPFAVEQTVVMPTCNGGMDGSITLNVSGATPPYQFSWQNGPFISDNFFNNIPIGLYTVTILDAAGCELDLEIQVDELELALDPNLESFQNPSCTGFSDGSISINIANGLPPYQYNYNDGAGFGSSNVRTGLPAGIYVVDVLDANLCMGQFTITLMDPPLLTLELNLQGISCFGEADAVLMAIVNGGTGAYTYNWSSGQNTPVLENLDEGFYQLTVTDANGCVVVDDTTIVQPPQLFLDLIEVIDNVCFGGADGSIEVLGSGGVPPYQYSVDGVNFQDDPVLSGLTAGNYVVTVLDANGCTETIEATVTEPPPLIVDASANPPQFDLGFSTQLLAIPSLVPVTYSWSPIDSLSCTDCPNPTANPVNTTSYTITITDENGCIATDVVEVRVIKNRPVYIPNAFSPNDDGRNDGFTVYAGPAVRQIRELKIFNRWGGLVFENNNFPPNDPLLGWDGTFKGQDAQISVYAYYALVEFIDGENLIFEGDVTVVR
ncbi:MAG TPA: gliding motility-associated C-terminal domain-containing protein [Saprospiraceae bacterium]|nr:gliding motility-associated C-terminal domain-containing protein [Saprospiraceae bacterium]HMQ82799.1 gliding motility-associated C-terminal domain-containing protein [Saprospiraceae bacterium]